MKTTKIFKQVFERKKKIAEINCTLSLELDKHIKRYLGFLPLELDFAVDTINEGIGDMIFEEFIMELDKIKKKQKGGGE